MTARKFGNPLEFFFFLSNEQNLRKTTLKLFIYLFTNSSRLVEFSQHWDPHWLRNQFLKNKSEENVNLVNMLASVIIYKGNYHFQPNFLCWTMTNTWQSSIAGCIETY